MTNNGCDLSALQSLASHAVRKTGIAVQARRNQKSPHAKHELRTED